MTRGMTGWEQRAVHEVQCRGLHEDCSKDGADGVRLKRGCKSAPGGDIMILADRPKTTANGTQEGACATKQHLNPKP
jgi:hypothetical protein